MAPLDRILELFSAHGYGILLPIATLEGPIATVVAGFLASSGILRLHLAYFVVVLGDLLGDTLYYALGRWGGRPLLLRHGHRVGFSAEKFSSMELLFRAYPARTLLFGKLQAWGSLLLMAAGASRMPILSFLGINLAASVVKSGVLILVGYFFAEMLTVATIDRYLRAVALVLFVAGIVVVRAFMKRQRRLAVA